MKMVVIMFHTVGVLINIECPDEGDDGIFNFECPDEGFANSDYLLADSNECPLKRWKTEEDFTNQLQKKI